MKIKKILISTLSVAAIILGAFAPAISTIAAESQLIEIDDIEDIAEQLSDGETVVLTENKDKLYKEVDCNTEIVTKEDWENTDIGEYPLDVHSAEWSQLSSIETAAACNMPKEYAQSLTTEELVDYAVNYPFLMDILAFDHIADGIDHLAKKSYLFEELFSRADCFDKLLTEYLNLEINYTELAESNDVCETNYDSELFIETYMGLNYDLLSENQAARFVEEYGNKYSNINSVFHEPLFSTLFYGAIEEKMGVIPENAVPESVAVNYVDSIDANDSSPISSSSYITCDICGATHLYTSITVNGKTVYCYKWLSGGYSLMEFAQMDKYMALYYPTFTFVSGTSSKYNCHSYAWYSTATSNIYWIDNPAPIYSNTSYWIEWRMPMRNPKDGDRITFWSGNSLQHSAIVFGSDYTDCVSKLGHYGVYKTTISEMKSFYNSPTTQLYLPK